MVTTQYVCKQFLRHKGLQGLKGSSISTYSNKINAYFIPYLPNLFLRITEKKIYKLVECLTGKLDRKTIIDIIRLLNAILKFAKEKKYIRRVIKIPCPSIRKKEITVLTELEQKTLESYLLNHLNHFNFGVLLVLYTGLRIGELSALQFNDIQNKVLKIERTLQRIKNPSEFASNKTIIVIDVPKGGSMRKIPLNPFILDIYSKIEKTKLDNYILTGNENFIEPRNIERKFENILNKCNIGHKEFHALRHSFATNCVKAGFELKTLSEILGHSNTSITLEYYIHSDFDFKIMNMKKLKPKVS